MISNPVCSSTIGESTMHDRDTKPPKGPCETFEPGSSRAFHETLAETMAYMANRASLADDYGGPPAQEESQARQVIRDRCADWSRRSDRWHSILDTARRRVADGDKAPSVIGAIVALLAWRYQTYAGALSLVGAFLCALVGWRARIGRGDLDDSHTEQCWLIADRMSEFYRGLIAQFGSVPDQLLLSKSQVVESEARIGLPEKVRDAISCVIKIG